MTDIDHEARYQRVQARLDAMAAQRHNARLRQAAAAREARETRLRAMVGTAVDTAVREALRSRGFTETTATPAAAVTESAPTAAQVKELHQMSTDEFREHSRQVFDQVGESLHSPAWRGRQPMTLSDFIARGR